MCFFFVGMDLFYQIFVFMNWVLLMCGDDVVMDVVEKGEGQLLKGDDMF